MTKSIFFNLNHKIENLYRIQPEINYDIRGETIETFDFKEYDRYLTTYFTNDIISVSQKNTLRGLHGDFITNKLIQCLKGSVILGVLDIRKESKTFLQQEIFYLNEKNKTQVFVPRGCLNGHYVLEDCIFSYKTDCKYQGQDKQLTFRWDFIKWPTEIINPILSIRDKEAILRQTKNIEKELNLWLKKNFNNI